MFCLFYPKMNAEDSYRMLLYGVKLSKIAIFIVCNDCTITTAHQAFQLLIYLVLSLVQDVLEKHLVDVPNYYLCD
jgi:hypothetical protein